MKSKDKLTDETYFPWCSILARISEVLTSPMKSGLLYANMWETRRKMKYFTPNIFSLFTLEAVCFKSSNPLTNPQVNYTTVIRTDFRSPVQFLTYAVMLLSFFVIVVVNYTKPSPHQLYLKPMLFIVLIFLKRYVFYTHCKLLQNLPV